MKYLIPILLTFSLHAQNKLILSGNLNGTYSSTDTICVIDGVGDTLILCAPIVEVLNGDFNLLEAKSFIDTCEGDNVSPGIGGLSDPCISDTEWNSGYSTFTDSASFFLESNFTYYEQYSLLTVVENCAIDTVFLESLNIIPPGGINRPPGGNKTFEMTFKAIDTAGNESTKVITWVREDDSVCGQ